LLLLLLLLYSVSVHYNLMIHTYDLTNATKLLYFLKVQWKLSGSHDFSWTDANIPTNSDIVKK